MISFVDLGRFQLVEYGGGEDILFFRYASFVMVHVRTL